MAPVIVAFQAVAGPPPVPLRSRPSRLRALPQFTSIVAWLASAVLHHRGEDVRVVAVDSVAPALRDQVEEETLRTMAALDPIAERVARRRARQVAAVELAKVLSEATDVELQDPAYLQDRGNVLADLVLERYRSQLVYGGAMAEGAH